MRATRTIAGITATVGWLCFAAYLILRDPDQLAAMTPNEWGDFLAGTFAPLAFLWLVLGYLQQGQELRVSSEALRLQAQELSNSVQQQRALVEVTRLQVESEREALAFERHLREDLSLPKFSVSGAGGSFRGDGESSYAVVISNTGHDATAFSAKLSLLGGPWREVMSYPMFAKGAQYGTSIVHLTPLPEGESYLLLNYVDGLGRPKEARYRITKDGEHDRAGLCFKHVEA